MGAPVNVDTGDIRSYAHTHAAAATALGAMTATDSGVQSTYGPIASPVSAALAEVLGVRQSTIAATSRAGSTLAELLQRAARAYESGDEQGGAALQAAAEALENPAAATDAPAVADGAGPVGALAGQIGQQIAQLGQLAAQAVTAPVQAMAQPLQQLPQQFAQGMQQAGQSAGPLFDSTPADPANPRDRAAGDDRDEGTERAEGTDRAEGKAGNGTRPGADSGSQPPPAADRPAPVGAEPGRQQSIPAAPPPAQTRPATN